MLFWISNVVISPIAALPIFPSDKHSISISATPDQTSSAVAYKGSDYSCFTMGFPFECIINKEARNKLMRGILNYLLTP